MVSVRRILTYYSRFSCFFSVILLSYGLTSENSGSDIGSSTPKTIQKDEEGGLSDAETNNTITDNSGSGNAGAPLPLDTRTNPTIDDTNLTEVDAVCPSNAECSKLGGYCIDCQFDPNCHYGKEVSVRCSVKTGITCEGSRSFDKKMVCRYCYQTEKEEHKCSRNNTCRVITAPESYYLANCTVKDDIICMGRRQFYKNMRCNWTRGYRWSTSLLLSITLGGFGVDRFYLGLWRGGIGKLFSFGGLGVWTIVDVVLIATGYVGPADGSLYIY